MKIGLGYFFLVVGIINLIVGIAGSAYPKYQELAGWKIIVAICFIVLGYKMIKNWNGNDKTRKSYTKQSEERKSNTSKSANPGKANKKQYPLSFLAFLKSHQNSIIVFLIANAFALFVNIFHIEGEFNTENDTCGRTINTKHTFLTRKYPTTPSGTTSLIDNLNSERFWPFVTFFEHGITNDGDYCSNPFYGVFVYYDYSEFIAYCLLLLIGLYFYWDKSIKTRESYDMGNSPIT